MITQTREDDEYTEVTSIKNTEDVHIPTLSPRAVEEPVSTTMVYGDSCILESDRDLLQRLLIQGLGLASFYNSPPILFMDQTEKVKTGTGPTTVAVTTLFLHFDLSQRQLCKKATPTVHSKSRACSQKLKTTTPCTVHSGCSYTCTANSTKCFNQIFLCSNHLA